ncbi:MAG TPA: hypothetical protein VFQ39_19135, partial [Longimicrobium sp.]|nr:hypothetical protein [Longimicrobium sp.]
GVVRPPSEAQLQSAAADGEQAVVRYSLGEQGVLEYRARNWRLVSVRRLQDGGVRESVELDRMDDGTLRRAQYRDWVQFRTLNLSLESQTDVAAFPDEVWSPPGTDR